MRDPHGAGPDVDGAARGLEIFIVASGSIGARDATGAATPNETLKRSADALGDFILQREHSLQFAIVGFGPNVESRRRRAPTAR